MGMSRWNPLNTFVTGLPSGVLVVSCARARQSIRARLGVKGVLCTVSGMHARSEARSHGEQLFPVRMSLMRTAGECRGRSSAAPARRPRAAGRASWRRPPPQRGCRPQARRTEAPAQPVIRMQHATWQPLSMHGSRDLLRAWKLMAGRALHALFQQSQCKQQHRLA